MAITKITGASIAADSIDGTKIADDAINSEHITDGGIDNVHIGDVAATKLTGTIASGRLSASNLGSGTVPTARLGSGTADTTTFLRGDGSWQVVTVPKLDSPVITGTLAVLDSGTVSHTISNWSDDISYTITPTNCTVGSVNSSGVFVVTHTSGAPSYTIVATTASLGLDDSATVTKNIAMQLTAPTLSSPANVATATNVVYTITSTTTSDDKIILDPGTANFTYQSVSVGSGSKVGNTVELTGFTTNNPAVTIQFTAQATYSVTAKSVNIAGTYTTSANSSADSITIQNQKGLTSGDPATGANEVFTTGSTTSGNYYINNYTTNDTTQLVYCWLDVNGDHWQKFAPFNTHMGMAHGSHVAGTSGSFADSFDQDALDHAQDFHKYTGTVGTGGGQTSTTGLWGRNVSTLDGVKIMTTSVADSTFNSSCVLDINVVTRDTYPDGYADYDIRVRHQRDQLDASVRLMGITSISVSGSNTTLQGKTWRSSSNVPADYELTSSASSQPSSPDNDESDTDAHGNNKLWILWWGWADFAPSTGMFSTFWVNT